jgi:hypothetical protein
MHQLMIRYKVKPDRVDENERLVRVVYEELSCGQRDGFQYSTYRLDDGVTFVHVVQSEEGRGPLSEREAFQRFTDRIAERCEEQPVAMLIETIGSYRGGTR